MTDADDDHTLGLLYGKPTPATEANIVQRCEQFAAEMGFSFVLEVDLVVEPGEERETRFKQLALEIGYAFIPGSEQLCFEERRNGMCIEHSMPLVGVLEQPADVAWDALETWLDTMGPCP